MKPWEYQAKPPALKIDKQPLLTEGDERSTLLLPWEEESYPQPKSPEGVISNDTLNRNKGETYRNVVPVHLPLKMLESLMNWTGYYHELRITHPGGLTINAKPEHVREALNLHPWGAVYITDDVGRFLVLSWGEVPTHALRELRDLETEELLVPEQVAA